MLEDDERLLLPQSGRYGNLTCHYLILFKMQNAQDHVDAHQMFLLH